MGHYNEEGSAPGLLRDKRGLVNRVRRLRGQVEAIERALDSEASCSDLLQRITAARGAISDLMAEVLEEHVRKYLLPNDGAFGSRQTDAAEELIEIIHYLTLAKLAPGPRFHSLSRGRRIGRAADSGYRLLRGVTGYTLILV
jgi:DNA-binding FrmR family transcriptional regulator